MAVRARRGAPAGVPRAHRRGAAGADGVPHRAPRAAGAVRAAGLARASCSAPWPSATAATLGRADEALAPIRALGRPGRRPAARAAVRGGAVLPRRDGAEGAPLLLAHRLRGGARRRAPRDPADLAATCPIPDAQVGILHVGGALEERARDDGAVGNRDARYVVGVNGAWDPDEPDADAFRAWVRAARERCRPFTHRRELRELPDRPTRATSASARRTARTTTACWRSSAATTPATCSASTATSGRDGAQPARSALRRPRAAHGSAAPAARPHSRRPPRC